MDKLVYTFPTIVDAQAAFVDMVARYEERRVLSPPTDDTPPQDCIVRSFGRNGEISLDVDSNPPSINVVPGKSIFSGVIPGIAEICAKEHDGALPGTADAIMLKYPLTRENKAIRDAIRPHLKALMAAYEQTQNNRVPKENATERLRSAREALLESLSSIPEHPTTPEANKVLADAMERDVTNFIVNQTLTSPSRI